MRYADYMDPIAVARLLAAPANWLRPHQHLTGLARGLVPHRRTGPALAST